MLNNNIAVFIINMEQDKDKKIRDKYYSLLEKEKNIDKQIKDHGKTIPTEHHVNVENDILNLNVKIESINFYHISIPAVNYWRHHVKNTGKI